MTGSEHFAVEVADGRYVRVITAGPPDGLALVFHTGTLRRTRCPAMAISRSSIPGSARYFTIWPALLPRRYRPEHMMRSGCVRRCG